MKAHQINLQRKYQLIRGRQSAALVCGRDSRVFLGRVWRNGQPEGAELLQVLVC